jgi:hypothetical protein
MVDSVIARRPIEHHVTGGIDAERGHRAEVENRIEGGRVRSNSDAG